MSLNEKGLTEQELHDLPEMDNVVLWNESGSNETVIDTERGEIWRIGLYNGVLCKSRVR